MQQLFILSAVTHLSICLLQWFLHPPLNHTSPLTFSSRKPIFLPNPTPVPTRDTAATTTLPTFIFAHTPNHLHPYLIKSSNSSLSVSYPSRFSNSSFIYQVFNPDLTISSREKSDLYSNINHRISSYNDLNVTLDIPSSNLCFFLVSGSPFLTFSVTQPTPLSITTIHAILSFSSNDSLTKHTFNFNNGQTWILYASSPIRLSHGVSGITSEPFSGIIRIALLPDSDLRHEDILDRFSSCYPLCGDAVFAKPFCVEYKWENRGWGDLLLLAHPLHLQLLSENGYNNVTVLNDFKYKSIDGDLVGVIGDSWILKTDPVSVTWHSTKGVKEESHDEIVSVLLRDVEDLNASAIATHFISLFRRTTLSQ